MAIIYVVGVSWTTLSATSRKRNYNRGCLTNHASKKVCEFEGGCFKIYSYTDVNGCTNLANAVTGQPIFVAADAVKP
jgi:hypothetical protein